MMTILHVIIFANFVQSYGGPFFYLDVGKYIDPAVTQIFLERTEFPVEVAIPAKRSGDPFNWNIYQAKEFFVRNVLRCIFRET